MGLAHSVGDHLGSGEAQMLADKLTGVAARVGKAVFQLHEAADADGKLAVAFELGEDADGVVLGDAAVGPDASGCGDAVGKAFPYNASKRMVHVGRQVRHAPHGVVGRRLVVQPLQRSVLVAANDAAFGIWLVGSVACSFERLAVDPAHMHVPRREVGGTVGHQLVKQLLRGFLAAFPFREVEVASRDPGVVGMGFGEFAYAGADFFLGGCAFEAQRVVGVLHDAVLNEMSVRVVEPGNHRLVSAVVDSGVRADMAIGLGKRYDVDYFVARDQHRTLDGFEGVRGEDTRTFDYLVYRLVHFASLVRKRMRVQEGRLDFVAWRAPFVARGLYARGTNPKRFIPLGFVHAVGEGHLGVCRRRCALTACRYLLPSPSSRASCASSLTASAPCALATGALRKASR